MSYFDQSLYAVRCEWGAAAIAELAPVTDLFVIVDVLSFSTCVSVAVERGATVFPYPWRDERALEQGRALNAEVAGRRGSGSKYNLSPETLRQLNAGDRLILPSPNGSRLTLKVGATPTLAGCPRNAQATARYIQDQGYKRVTIVPAGELWGGDNSLRPALEDFIGAGSIVHELRGVKSAEAQAAEAVFLATRERLAWHIGASGTGRELTERGYPSDIAIAAELNHSGVVAIFRDGAYVGTRVD